MLTFVGRWPAFLAGVVAVALVGCGGDDDDETSAATTDTTAAEAETLQDEIAGLSDEQQIERVGDAWAQPFADGDETMCGYLHPDLGGPSSCARYVEGELIGSSERQGSFAGSTVETVKINGQAAVAEFSNGEQMEFQQDPEGAWRIVGVVGERGSPG